MDGHWKWPSKTCYGPGSAGQAMQKRGVERGGCFVFCVSSFCSEVFGREKVQKRGRNWMLFGDVVFDTRPWRDGRSCGYSFVAFAALLLLRPSVYSGWQRFDWIECKGIDQDSGTQGEKEREHFRSERERGPQPLAFQMPRGRIPGSLMSPN